MFFKPNSITIIYSLFFFYILSPLAVFAENMPTNKILIDELKKNLLEDKEFINQFTNESVQNCTESYNQAIKNYLLANPSILFDLEKKLEAQESDARRSILVGKEKELFYDSEDAVFGNPNGSIRIADFFDYNCGYCKKSILSRNKILKKYPNVRFVTKELPILGPDSLSAHRISQAVRLSHPEIYSLYQTQLLEVNGHINLKQALEKVSALKLNSEKIKALFNQPMTDEHLRKNMKLSQELGIRGTPAYVIEDQIFYGFLTAEQMITIIEELHLGPK